MSHARHLSRVPRPPRDLHRFPFGAAFELHPVVEVGAHIGGRRDDGGRFGSRWRRRGRLHCCRSRSRIRRCNKACECIITSDMSFAAFIRFERGRRPAFQWRFALHAIRSSDRPRPPPLQNPDTPLTPREHVVWFVRRRRLLLL